MDLQTWNNEHFPSYCTYVFIKIIKKLREVKVPSGGLKEEEEPEEKEEVIKNLLFWCFIIELFVVWFVLLIRIFRNSFIRLGMKYTILISLASLLIITTALQTTHLAGNSSTCLPPGLWNASALTCVCQNGSAFDTVSGSCLCLPATPWLNNGSCQTCNFPDTFDNATKQCYTCPHGFAYNLTVHYCQSIVCPPG